MMKKWIAFLLFAALFGSLTACASSGAPKDLMKDVQRNLALEWIQVEESAPGDFPAAYKAFSSGLFRATALKNPDENILISPLSVSLALSVAANGAEGDTKEQMMRVLAGNMEIDTWNRSMCGYVSSLTESKNAQVNIANSLWFRENAVTVNPSFLQQAADYYDASAYAAPFDQHTAEQINQWCKKETNGMIDNVVGEIPEDTMLYLINALAFEADWQNPYPEPNVHDDIFTAFDGREQSVEMMFGTLYSYVETDGAVGFCKDYKGGSFRFVALLPDEGTDASDFAATFTAEKMTEVLSNVTNVEVRTRLPKFSYEYSVSLKDTLTALGMEDVFDAEDADLSGMGNLSKGDNLYVEDVAHKTFIEVFEQGTRAAAITEIPVGSGRPQKEPKEVYLDRPFVFFIVDSRYNLPLFMGVVNGIE